jgi:hypothetical protein
VPTNLTTALLAALVLSLPLQATSATASGDEGIRLAQASAQLTREQAAERAADETGGKVLSAEPLERDGTRAYRVKVLTPDGHVKTVVIEGDAGSATPPTAWKASTSPASTRSTRRSSTSACRASPAST